MNVASHPAKTQASDIHDLSSCRTVIADCCAALDHAHRLGLPPAATIVSSSPALALDDALKERVREAPSAETVRALEDATFTVAERLLDLKCEDADWPLVSARCALFQLQLDGYWASFLTERDLDESIAVVSSGTNISFLDGIDGHPATGLLRANDALHAILLPKESRPPVPEADAPPPGLRQRLAFASGHSILYRALVSVWSRLGRSPRGTYLIYRENELVKEVGAELALRGYGLARLLDPGKQHIDVPPLPSGPDDASALVEDAFRNLIPPGIASALARRFGDVLTRTWGHYISTIAAWQPVLERERARGVRAILSNILPDPQDVALHAAARRARLPIVMFQHGVATEISARSICYRPNHENVTGDLTLTFNETARETLDASPCPHSPAVSVGLSGDHFRVSRAGGWKDAPPLWYISTALYNGLVPQIVSGVSDAEMAIHERSLVDEVFCKLPHRVLYKPYPGIRYLDPDPVIEDAASRPNIEVLAERIDLRYIAGAARVLVTSRATSTVSWCLLSGRPTVFIDLPAQMPLRDDTREAFETGLFLFHGSEPDWRDKLREFLSRPIADIESDWAAREPERQRLISQFFSPWRKGAGVRGADAIRKSFPGGRE